MKSIDRRLTKLEESVLPRNDGMFTIEELCRSMWRSNPAHCRELAQESGDSIMRSYIPIFEAEDAKRSHGGSGNSAQQNSRAWEEFLAEHQSELDTSGSRD
jgi:hypothetical protein